MEDYKFLFKVVLVGNAGVGKTCLVRRFTQGMFPPGQGATIGVDFMIKTVEIDGEKIKVRNSSFFCYFLADFFLKIFLKTKLEDHKNFKIDYISQMKWPYFSINGNDHKNISSVIFDSRFVFAINV